MKSVFFRRRSRWLLCVTAAICPVFSSCLSDQQVTSIFESVISAGLSTIVTNAISAALTAGAV